MQINDRYGFLFAVAFLSGLYSVIKPQAVKKENADVPGFPKSPFSRMPAWGWRLAGIALLAVSGLFLYLSQNH